MTGKTFGPTVGFVAAALAGTIWFALGGLIVAVILAIAFGLDAHPVAGAAALAGLLAGPAWVVPALRGATARVRIAITAAVGAIVYIALAGGAPFGLSGGDLTWGLFAALVLAGTGATATHATMAGLNPAALNRYRLEIIFIRVCKGVGLTVFTILVALPFYAMLMTSFKTQSALLANPLDYSIDISAGLVTLFSSYLELFTTFGFGRFILVSIFVSVATVLITLAFSIPGAYAVSRLSFPGRAMLARSVLLIYMVPAIVLVIPLYSVFSQVGLRDSLLGLLIIYPATTIPVALYMLQGYFRDLPAELEEAGLMDGCSRLGVILKITLPLSLPAIASVSLYVFMIAWNEFLFAFMFLDDPSIFTLSRAVVSLNSSEVPRQHLMAGAVVVTIPVLVIFLWFERFLVSGLTAGSVKG